MIAFSDDTGRHPWWVHDNNAYAFQTYAKGRRLWIQWYETETDKKNRQDGETQESNTIITLVVDTAESKQVVIQWGEQRSSKTGSPRRLV